MAANLWHTATSNAFNTTLNGNVLAGDTSITLTSVTGLNTTGGVLCIDRQDVNNVDTPALREYVSYTGISGSAITGCTRGLGGSTAQSHVSSAKVEENFSISHWNDLLSSVVNVLTTAGALDTTKVVDLTSSQTLTNKTLTAPIISTISNTGTVTLPTASDTLVGRATTDTLTNKRISKRILSATSYTTDTGSSLNCDTLDMFIVTAQAGALKFLNPSGTPTDGQTLWLAVTGTAARALTYDTQFESSAGATLPTTTVTTARIDIGLVWRADTSKWHCIAVA